MAQKTNRWVVPRFLKGYARRYIPVYALGLTALVATNYINVLIPEYIQTAIDALDANAGHRKVQIAAWSLGGLAFVVVLTRTMSRILFFNPGRTIEFRLKNAYFEHVMRLPLKFFQEWTSGDVISRGTNDMMYVRTIIGYATLQLLNVCIALSMALYKMASIDVFLTLSCTLPLVVGMVILRRGVKLLIAQFRMAQEELSKLSTSILDSYSGAPIIQSLRAEATFDSRVREQNNTYIKIFESSAMIRAFYLPIVSVAGSSCLAILLLYGGKQVIEGDFTIGEIAAYASYIGIVVASLTSSGWMISAIQRGLVSLERVYEVFDVPTIIPDTQNAPPQPPAPSSPVSLKANGLSFRYEGEHAERFELSGIDFDLKPGQTLGLFGATGSGKSSLLSILAGIHPIPADSLFVDGEDVSTLDDATLRRKVALVPQNAYLFSRTLRENIGFADLRTHIREEKIQQATELACLTHDLEALTDGIDTLVGERGVTLSGGQRQRVALARAFYRDFGLLLLDDVLSAVDHNTEKALIEGIRQRTDSFTTVIASHRLSALIHSNEILVLDAGKVIARGSHEDLIAMPGPYREAWEREEAGEAHE